MYNYVKALPRVHAICEIAKARGLYIAIASYIAIIAIYDIASYRYS